MPSFHGNFVWYELMTSDIKAAQAFYTRVVGWGARDASMPGMDYTLFTIGDERVAGLMGTPPDAAGMPPCWFGYIAVDDVDAAAARLQKLGGVVHRAPQDIPGVGRFSVVADPQGAGFMLFKGNEEMAPTSPAAWRELYAVDWEAAFDFYAALFGWTKVDAMDMGPMGVYQTFAANGETIGGMMTKAPDRGMPAWTYYFKVDAIGAAVERLKAAGGTITNGPMQVPTGDWMVQVRDPQGASFALHSPRN